MFYALARALLYPFRWNATHLPRGSFLRSASIPILKFAARRPALLNSIAIITPLDRRDVSFVPARSIVMDTAYWFGTQGYEGLLAILWPRLCAKAKAVLELSGNVGFYTVLGGKAASGAYTVVEPLPDFADILRRNLALNKLDRVDVVKSALNICLLAEGRDLIKLDADGTEHAVLEAALPIIARNAPTIVVKVMPDNHQLAALLASVAQSVGYTIYVIPSFRTEYPVAVPPASFTARTPAMFQSKDVILTRDKL